MKLFSDNSMIVRCSFDCQSCMHSEALLDGGASMCRIYCTGNISCALKQACVSRFYYSRSLCRIVPKAQLGLIISGHQCPCKTFCVAISSSCPIPPTCTGSESVATCGAICQSIECQNGCAHKGWPSFKLGLLVC
jgi:hypothetical protein